METETMGKVLVAATIENSYDAKDARDGKISHGDVRRVEILDARVDTGATYVALPQSLIQRLGLKKLREARSLTANGVTTIGIYEPVRLIIEGRDCTIEVSELADGCPVLIGYIPLEMLDFVVDPKGQRLLGNPEHDGEWIIDLL
jgi:predicted aspartyl protease